jgi:tryptophan-rich sensory protein
MSEPARTNPSPTAADAIEDEVHILATLVSFYRVDKIAAWCRVPLAAWVCFATVLNFSIWKLSP